MNSSALLDAIIVGGGHAGLSASYYLKRHGIRHTVLERGKPGESWVSQRWGSFKLNTPNKLNTLPGFDFEGVDPEGFCTANELAAYYKNYIAAFELPVEENTKVTSIEKNNDYFIVTVSQNDIIRQYQSKELIIATGIANEKNIPAFAPMISKIVQQLHTAEYRTAKELPAGNVLVVGGAQSGLQIAEDLADAGRKVYLSTSMVARAPRSYRGRDIHDWLIDMKFFDATKEQITDPAMLKMKPPHLTGVGDKPKTISLQSLAKKGVTIIGKMENANNSDLSFQPNAAMHVKFADGFSDKLKQMIDEFIMKNQLQVPDAETDIDDLPDANAECASSITLLNTTKDNIQTIIWTTGFKGNFKYIKLPVFDTDGLPKQRDGVSDISGLYFIGFPWLRSRKSVTLFGIKEDAEFIAGKVFQHVNNRKEAYTESK